MGFDGVAIEGDAGGDDSAFTKALSHLRTEHESLVYILRADIERLQNVVEQGSAAPAEAVADSYAASGPRARPGDLPHRPLQDDAPVMAMFALDSGLSDASHLEAESGSRAPRAGFSRQWTRSSDEVDARASRFPSLESIQSSIYANRVSRMSSSSTNHSCPINLVVLDSFIGLAIIANTALLGISADVYPDWVGWIVVDAIFASVFIVELLIKIYIHGCKRFFGGKERFTHYCEVLLVPLAMLEVVLTASRRETVRADSQWSLTLFSFVRLFRVSRVVRVLRLDMFVELKVMILGAVGGLRTLMWSIMLIILPVYALSLVLRDSLGKVNETGRGAEYFSSVPRSFFSVFRCVVVGECTDNVGRPLFVHVSDTDGWGFALVYSVTVAVMYFGLFNVIAAMFVENVVTAAKNKARLARKERLLDHGFFARNVAKLLALVCEIHNAHTGNSDYSNEDPENFLQRASVTVISPETFELVRHDKRVQRIFDELDLADEDQMNLFTMLDADGSGSVSLEEICSGIAKLRGEACRSDIISINLMMQDIRVELRSALSCLMRRICKQQDMIKELGSITDMTASHATTEFRYKSMRRLMSD